MIKRSNSSTQLLSRPKRNAKDDARSIDQFYNEAGENDTKPQALRYWIILFAMGMAHSGDACEILNMNFVLSNDEFSQEILKGDFAVRGSILAACVFAGMLVGGVLTGAFGDQMGRRPILIAGLTLNTTAGVMAALAPNIYLICFFRLIAGAGIGAILSTVMTLVAESSAPTKRGRNIGFVSTFFTLGTIYVAILAIYLFGHYQLSWRVFMVFCAVPTLIGNIMMILFVPESARYLAIKNRPEEACASANRISDSMGYRGPQLEVDEMKFHYGNSYQTPEKFSVREVFIKTFQNISMLYEPNIRWTTITLQILWVTDSFGSGLIMWINMVLKQIHVKNIFVDSLYFSAASIPGNIVTALLVDRVGRKKLLVSSLVLCSCSLLFFAQVAEYAKSDDDNGTGLSAVICACFFHFFMIIAWCTTNIITCELFPTEVRTTGCGLCTATGRLAAMFSQYVFGSLIDRPSLLLSLTSLAMFLGCFCMCFIKDTTNIALQDTVAKNEGKETISFVGSLQKESKDVVERNNSTNTNRKPAVELV